jgi:hypothetical protein
MEASTLATIAAFLFLTFADQVMTGVWAWRLGPNRARRLIMQDPLFHELRSTLQANVEQLASAKTDLLAVRHDMEGLSTRMTQQVSSLQADLSKQLKALPTPEVTAQMQLPVTMQDSVQRDIRAAARAAIKEATTEGLQAVVEDAIAKAMAKLEASKDPDQVLKDIEAQAEKDMLKAYVVDLAAQRGVPPIIVDRAYTAGSAVLARLGKRLEEQLEERIG